MTRTLVMAAGNEPATVRQLVADATALLGMTTDDTRAAFLQEQGPGGYSPLERLGRLRDEFHVTANRIARFKLDDQPVVDPVHIGAPTASTAVLGPAQLLVQLNMEADRLMAMLDELTPREWLHFGRAGDRRVTLGELVDGVLDAATRDILEILERSPTGARHRLAVFPDRPPRHFDEDLPHAVSI
jgi:hypothetical protein